MSNNSLGSVTIVAREDKVHWNVAENYGKNQANLIRVDMCVVVTNPTWLKITQKNGGTISALLFFRILLYFVITIL